MQRALKAGAVLLSECKALKIETDGTRARRVVARGQDGARITIEARQIVVACGGIASSELLLRSGITRNVGTGVSLNVRSVVFAEFAQPINSFQGIAMSAYLKRPRYTLESCAMGPAAFASTLPGWFNDHFDNMHAYPHFAVASVLVGTQSVGKISLVDETRAALHFDLPLTDLRKVKEGIRQLCRVELAAGAQRVLPATFVPSVFYDTSQLDALDELIVETDDVALSSLHVQGGNPMNADPALGVVDTQFRVYGFDNLYVCDASVFPTTLQVEPQMTIMALADYAAQGMLATSGSSAVPVAVHRTRSARTRTNVEPSVEA
jgi:choline dehydrogenase-like flavoprotein